MSMAMQAENARDLLEKIQSLPAERIAAMVADAGTALAVLLGGGRLGEQHEAGEEGRDRVGVGDLGHHAVLPLIGVAGLVVLVPGPPAALEVAPRVLVAAPPLVELLVPFRLEILAVLGVAAAGMGVGCDQNIGFVAQTGSPSMSVTTDRIPTAPSA